MVKDYKMLEVEAKLFEMGMEDGYACYPVFFRQTYRLLL